jgi:hypothetical protein
MSEFIGQLAHPGLVVFLQFNSDPVELIDDNHKRRLPVTQIRLKVAECPAALPELPEDLRA